MDGSNLPSPAPMWPAAPSTLATPEHGVNQTSGSGRVRPGLLARSLMAIAGVDCQLASTCPPNEWRSMSLAGASLLAGAAFTGACIWIALGELFRDSLTAEGRGIATALATIVRFIVDRKFVTADWYAQGLSYSWSHGLIDVPPLLVRFKRSVGVFGRLIYSLAFSSLIAMVLMTIVFRDITHRWLVQENLRENTAVLRDANLQYDRRLREIGDQIEKLETAARALEEERRELLQPAPSDPSHVQQLEKLLARIESLRIAKTEAERAAAVHESDRNAEKAGVRARSTNTGKDGEGQKFVFHREEALRLRAEVEARSRDLLAAEQELQEARRSEMERERRIEDSKLARQTIIETQVRDAKQATRDLAAERAAMQTNREASVDQRMRASPAYKPLPTDIGDRLRALRAVASSTSMMFLLVLILELTIVAFESAGPIGKVFFTPPTHYAMWLALRLEDATDQERHRRVLKRRSYDRLDAEDAAPAKADARLREQ